MSIDSRNLPTTWAAAWLARAVTHVLTIYVVAVELLLAFGFVLLLFGANPSSSFTEWIYRNMEGAMEPFRSIFAPIELGLAGNDVPAVFESSVLFAMVVYGVLAIGLQAFINWLSLQMVRIERTRAEENRTLRRPLASSQPPSTVIGSSPSTTLDRVEPADQATARPQTAAATPNGIR